MLKTLHECFEDKIVYKDLKKSNFFSSLGLPSFLRDWTLARFEDSEGSYDVNDIISVTYFFKKLFLAASLFFSK